ncbi:MAG: cytochrome c maturation protein CcmE [Thermoanaerobaculia bacterium]
MNATSEHRNRRWYAAGALAVAAAAFVVITAGGIGENLVYYWGPAELKEAGEKAVGATIRLGGQVVAGSITGSGGPSSLAFDVTDGKEIVHVRASGVPPQLFREGIGVVVEGTMTREGYFAGKRLMVSHDNEYRAPREGEGVDTEKLIRSATDEGAGA